jgi:hypothetical protein
VPQQYTISAVALRGFVARRDYCISTFATRNGSLHKSGRAARREEMFVPIYTCVS